MDQIGPNRTNVDRMRLLNIFIIFIAFLRLIFLISNIYFLYFFFKLKTIEFSSNIIKFHNFQPKK